MGLSRPLFIYFRLFYKQFTVYNCSIKVAVTGFEPGYLDIGSDRAANRATIPARKYTLFIAITLQNFKNIWKIILIFSVVQLFNYCPIEIEITTCKLFSFQRPGSFNSSLNLVWRNFHSKFICIKWNWWAASSCISGITTSIMLL